jgi:amino acid adenylation domain-containing protein
MTNPRQALFVQRGPSTVVDPYADESVCAMFERQVERTPNAIALICEDRSLTYAELDRRVSQLARYLKARHAIRPEAIVGLLLGRSERMLISMLAVLKARAAYLPIAPDYPASRIEYVLQDASPALLITEDEHAGLVRDYTGARVSWDEALLPWAGEPTDRMPGDPDVRQLVYVMYTSGSTGRPKGVMVEHRNLTNFIQWCQEEYRESRFDIVYAGTPYGFDLSNVELFFPLTVGRPIRLLRASQAFALYLRRDRNVFINTVPSLVQEMLKTDGSLNNVSVLNLGGEAIQPSLVRGLRAYRDLEVRNMYGPTETTSTAINSRMDIQSDEILIGKPIANTVVYILDEDMRQVPVGSKGEICIGGRGVTRGYWKRPELTEERFVDDPFRSGQRLYRTGDIGLYLPDGNIRCFGRNDNQVKVRGFRVELDEIANQLTTHPDLTAATVGLLRSSAGDRLVAYACGTAKTNADALRAFLRERLPAYMVPDSIDLLDELPLTPTGKIDREALFGRL